MPSANQIALKLLRALERAIDAGALARIEPTARGASGRRPLYAGIGALLLLGSVLATFKIAPELALARFFSTPEAGVEEGPVAAGPELPEGVLRTAEGFSYTCKGREGAGRVASRLYDLSLIFEQDELREKLISNNPGSFRGDSCVAGALIQIPEPSLAPIQNQAIGDVAVDAVRAVYLRGENMRPSRLANEVRRLRAIGANGVVFDVKDIIGVVNYRSEAPDVERYRRHQPPIRNIRKTIRFLHENGIYVIARTALFQDENLATQRPDLAIHDRNAPGGILLVKGKPLWVDVGREEVRRYNLGLVQELVALGVDEIQFDYVRYPAEGNLSGAVYHDVREPKDKTRHLVEFLAGAWMFTRASDTRVSIDIFGIVAWGEEVDLKTTGQRIEYLSQWVDILSPMLYPSHFHRGWGGIANPADEPYRFYHEGIQKFRQRSYPGVVIRPWLQAFKWRVTRYDENYIREQIRGSNDAGGVGWMMWNAGNDYDVVYSALRDRESLTTQRRVESDEVPPGG